MIYRYLLISAFSVFSCLPAAFAQDLDFATAGPIYPDGATSHQYSGIGTPAVDVQVSVSGNGTFSNASPRPAGTGLSTPSLNFGSSTETMNYTFAFSQAVTGLEFPIRAIQYKTDFTNTSHNYQDRILIIATDPAGNPVTPIIPAGSGYSVVGNEILATSSMASNVPNITFSGSVKTLTIVYGNGPLAGPDPNPQGFTIGDMEWAGVVLPVRLTGFWGRLAGNTVRLSWETAWERNADRFIIEFSPDLPDFYPIGEVPAAGETDRVRTYAFVDDRPRFTTGYYRLKQIDHDGSVAYSKPIAVSPENREESLAVYPNPSDGRRIFVRSGETDPASLQLIRLSGQPVPCRRAAQEGGTVLLEPFTPLPAGVYLLRSGNGKAARLVVR
ncbi:T9SS type A sorting domain-containing protein [Larkinella soli]|uniref:T9SS type A sorting domain-containing protein n=1 Tax=Larkinella soli TaxID=1770527 RepID=UPI000FFC211D|nr:T9SS type A sorting domain-containing protein [Larkinella soli]